MKAKILTLLREREDYVSGQELSRNFGVSRTAVWKAVEQLKKEGYTITAVRNRGYKLVEQTGHADVEIYNGSELISRMHTGWAGKPVLFYNALESTNTRAKQEAEAGAAHGTLVVTDMQTNGRGRRGRGWSSPAGKNIYFTLILRPDIVPDKTSMLTLVMAHAVAEGIRQTLAETLDAPEQDIDQCQNAEGKVDEGFELPDIGIKWPNDIVINGKKVCGILTEMSLSVEQAAVQYVVIGVGINVRRQTFAPEILDKATCLEEACGRPVSRSGLIAHIMQAFEEDYASFMAHGSLVGLKASYDNMLVNVNREVCVLEPSGEYRGTARGITDAGELLVELPDGTVNHIYAGEVSVRGIYGYV